MARSLTLSAYLALHRGKTTPLPDWRRRPNAPVVWIRCGSPTRLAAAEAIASLHEMEDLGVEMLITGAGDSALYFTAQNPNATQIEAFLDHWKPDAVLWLGGENLDPAAIVATHAREIPNILVEASGPDLTQSFSGWFPGMPRAVMQRLSQVLCTDAAAQKKLLKTKLEEAKVEITGTIDEDPEVLDFDEDQFAAVNQAIGTRQCWLAAPVRLAEANILVEAHKHACRRAHRLLLIVVPALEEDASAIADGFRAHGFETLLSADGTEISETTRVLVLDTDGDDLGLWYRISPITYAAGTLIGGNSQDPFDIATLGSSIIHGPIVGAHALRYARLDQAGGCLVINNAGELGAAVETLLSPDRTATIAMAAWDVTSGGAIATSRVASLIRDVLERKGY